jgi:hypothetical protein
MRYKILFIATALLLIAGIVGIADADTRASWQGTANLGRNMTYTDGTWTTTYGASLWATCPQLASLDPKAAQVYMVDFTQNVDTLSVWTVTAGDVGGTHACIDSVGGYYGILTHSTDNDEAYLMQTVATWKFATSKPLWFEWYGSFFASTDSTYADNFIIGLVSTAVSTANMLQDNGAGPPGTYTGAVWYKTDSHGNATNWNTETSETTTQQTKATQATFATITATRLGILYDGAGNTKFYKDGALVATHSTTQGDGAVLRVIIGAKTGGGNRTEIKTDYIKVVQIR